MGPFGPTALSVSRAIIGTGTRKAESMKGQHMCQCHDDYVDRPTTAAAHHPVADMAGDQCHDLYQTASESAPSPSDDKPESSTPTEPVSV